MSLDFAVALSAKDLSVFSFEKADSLVAEKQIIYVGTFYQEKDDEWFNVDESDIDNWIDEFARYTGNGNEVPLPEEHDFLPSARKGTILGFDKKIDDQGRLSLFAKVKFKDAEAKDTFSEAQVSLYSPPQFTDGRGNSYRRPITHVALTDYPVVPDLGKWRTIAASAIVQKKGKPMLKQLALSLGLQVPADSSDEAISSLIGQHFSTLSETLKTNQETITKLSKDLETAKASTPTDPEPVSISAGIMDMARESRQLKLSRLVENSKISPNVKDRLEEIFVKDDNTLTLSLSRKDASKKDVFDSLVDALSSNEVVNKKEKTSAQVLKFSADKEGGDTLTNNVLTRMAEAKAKEFANN